MWQPSAIPGGSGCEMKHASSLMGVAFVTSITQRLVSTCRKALALMIGKPGTKQLKDISPETPRATVNAGARGGRPTLVRGPERELLDAPGAAEGAPFRCLRSLFHEARLQEVSEILPIGELHFVCRR